LLFAQYSLLAQQTPPAATTTTVTSATPAPATPAKVDPKKRAKKKLRLRDRIAIDADAGVAYPFTTDIADIYTIGFNGSLGVKMAFLKKKLWVRPVGGIKFYTKKAEMEESLQETFRNWKAGIEFQYQAAAFNKYALYPIFRIDNNWSANNFSKTSSKEPGTTARTVEVSDKVLSGNGVSFDIGLMLVRTRSLYLKLDYEYYKPTLKVNPDLVKELLVQGVAIESQKAFDCSTINLSIGVNLNFSKQ
jgi:hypothetical protein